MTKFYTQSGSIELGEGVCLGGSEGSVLAVQGESGRVAKVFHAPGPRKIDKVRALASVYAPLCGKTPSYLRRIAWPQELLYRDPALAEPCGFLMAAAPAGSVSIDALADRASFGPAAALDALIDLCDVVSFLHALSIVVGDLNPNNLLFSPDGRAFLCDVDGYHVALGDGRTYPCAACCPGYVAPELARRTCGGARRVGYLELFDAGEATFTVRTDLFALAAHIFRTLNNGVHPYAGAVVADASGDFARPRPVDELVARGLSPFAGNMPGMAVKPWALDPSAFGPRLSCALERSLWGSTKNPARRLNAYEWADELRIYRNDSRLCPKGHLYYRGLDRCPYCEAGDRAGR